MLKIKFKAFSIHLAISFVVIAVVVGVIIFFWYPTQYIGVTSFKDIATLIILIDLILGPLLTFVIFNPKKKSLQFDLTVVAAIQLSALIYGINALYQTHPLYITFSNHGYFNLIQANEVTPADAKYEEYKISKLESAKFAFTKMPDDPQKQAEIMAGVDLKGEPDIDKRTEYYEPYKNNMDIILTHSLNSAKIFNKNNLNNESRKFLTQYGNKKDTFAYMALKGTTGSAILVLNKETAQPVTTINIEPWKFKKL